MAKKTHKKCLSGAEYKKLVSLRARAMKILGKKKQTPADQRQVAKLKREFTKLRNSRLCLI